MSVLTVECLRCGAAHELVQSPWRRLQRGHCPRCGYVGWAEPAELDEHVRHELRELPVEGRRARIASKLTLLRPTG